MGTINKNDLVTVKTFQNEIEAELAKERLENEGIKCFLFKDDCGGAEPNMQLTLGVDLKVRQADFARASERLKSSGVSSRKEEELNPGKNKAVIYSLLAWFLSLFGGGLIIVSMVHGKDRVIAGIVILLIGILFGVNSRYQRKKMKNTLYIIIVTCSALVILSDGPVMSQSASGSESEMLSQQGNRIELPEPRLESHISIEQTLLNRRSLRSYKNQPLTIVEVGQLLWAAQGITEKSLGFRTAPSAGATYPFEVYLVAGEVAGLTAGIYQYDYQHHRLILRREGDFRDELAESALGQSSVANGAINIVLTGIYERTTQRYGDRGIRYVHIEAGHIAQNVLLQAVALGLGSVPVGAFNDNNVQKNLDLPENEIPLYILPVGRG
jgi:SagB-type dehydrogenase family enzyme